ncbi:MAG: hypothetical protein ABL901_14180 [Hyphomicrobiaceae bacterium]
MRKQAIIDQLERRREALYKLVGRSATPNDWFDLQAQIAVETLRTLDDIQTTLEALKTNQGQKDLAT